MLAADAEQLCGKRYQRHADRHGHRWGMIDSEVYRFPLYVSRQAVALSFLGIIAATVFSGLVVRRRLDHLDLVAVLKIRE